MVRYAIQPLSLVSGSGQHNIREIIVSF